MQAGEVDDGVPQQTVFTGFGNQDVQLGAAAAMDLDRHRLTVKTAVLIRPQNAQQRAGSILGLNEMQLSAGRFLPRL